MLAKIAAAIWCGAEAAFTAAGFVLASVCICLAVAIPLICIRAATKKAKD